MMTLMRPLAPWLAALWLALAPLAMARAQGLDLAQGNGAPLEIDAEQGIEWRQEEQRFIARGNAQAVRGQVRVSADTLIAWYRDTAEGTQIYRLEARGSVEITSPREQAVGERAVYDLDQAVVVLSGGDLRFTTPTDEITAKDSLEYWENRRLAVARGDAAAIRGDRVVRADVLSAVFSERDGQAGELVRVDAYDNVRLRTDRELVTGSRGVYDVKSALVTLSGSVKITRGDNQLNGAYAEVDLNTGISRLLADPAGNGKVKGLLTPKRETVR